MKYDKSLKNKEDKELWEFLQGGVFSDTRCECMKLRRQGYTKKEIVDMYRPIYEWAKKEVEKLEKHKQL